MQAEWKNAFKKRKTVQEEKGRMQLLQKVDRNQMLTPEVISVLTLSKTQETCSDCRRCLL